MELAGTGKDLVLLLCPPLLLAAFLGGRRRRWGRFLFAGLAAAATAALGLRQVQIGRQNIAHPRAWDFLVFWVNGRVASEGHNFYDLDHAWRVVATQDLPIGRAVDASFFYPPPTMLLFLPLGWFDPQTACALWSGLNAAVLAADAVLLWRLFPSGGGWTNPLLATSLLLALKATSQTAYLAQTNFIVLMWLLLLWRGYRRSRGGPWLALGMLVKPVLSLVALVPIARLQAALLLRTAATLAVAAAGGADRRRHLRAHHHG